MRHFLRIFDVAVRVALCFANQFRTFSDTILSLKARFEKRLSPLVLSFRVRFFFLRVFLLSLYSAKGVAHEYGSLARLYSNRHGREPRRTAGIRSLPLSPLKRKIDTRPK